MLFFKTHSASSNNDSVEIVLSSLESRAFLTAFKPSSCGILGYRPTTSIVAIMNTTAIMNNEYNRI